MDWPETSVEEVPAREFVPPHCPNPTCRHYRAGGPDDFPWIRHGHYVRPSDERAIPRFRCRTCGRTFSQQTFSTTYWLRRRELLVRIAEQIVAGSCLRQIGRTLGCSHQTVMCHLARLGRHGMLLATQLLDELERRGGLGEKLVWDHLETFAICQLLPLGQGTLVSARSGLLLWVAPVVHARGGRKTPAQRQAWKALVERHGRPPRDGYRRGTEAMLERMLAVETRRPLRLVSDGHKGYARAVRRLQGRGERIEHEAHPNPSRRERREDPARARGRDRALRMVDRLHALWRHSHAHDRRETLAFARRHNAAAERGFVIAAWRNWIKGCSERRPDSPTPAQQAGLDDRRRSWKELLARRLFPGRIKLPAAWKVIYWRGMRWPEIANWTRHDLKYAF